ncbi:MAG TPA: alkaline phosphatase family protein [Terriglobia bacterium]|nr:alkaline phosphatase family protein [Terriglobia bacterium]
MGKQSEYCSTRPKYAGSCLGANARGWRLLRLRALALFLVLLMSSGSSFSYSVLTHEEIVDLLWKDEIRPLLLQRFPGLTEDQITEAHAYAYGGAVIQDLGYYPFGSKQFSDLVHYVRSGDFVRELLLESQDANEYAFAMGALAHYASDIAGHPTVNWAVAVQYPKLRAKFGNSVKYADDKTAHIRTEFGFDMVQVAKNRYASQQYHDFIGFQVSKPLLERVFPVVYGVELKDVLPREDLAIGSYRYSVSRLIPEMTRVALRTHKKDMMREEPSFSKRKFLYRLSRSDYEKNWGKDYTKPGFLTRVLSVFLRYMPKIGPFKALAFNNPTAQTEDQYFKSINTSVDQYRAFLEEGRTHFPQLADIDFDTGKKTQAAEYTLTDDAYAKLLVKLSERQFDRTSPELRENILNFYSDLSAPIQTKKDPARWQAVLTSLDQLKAVTLVPAPAASPPPAQGPALPLVPVASAGKHFDRVLIIVLENQNYVSAMKDPFLAQLAQTGASFSNFKALSHPSYPNYLAMVAGSSFGVHSNQQITLPDDSSHRTIADFLDWKNYAEDYPSEPEPFLGDRGKYARKHVPFLSFAKVQQESFGNVVSVDTQDPHNRFVADVEGFRSDPKKHPLPRYMFYSPNVDDDGHDPVLRPHVGLKKASSWLNRFLKNSLPLDEKMKGTLIVVTFDESETLERTNRIYTVFLGDMVKPGEITKAYTHYSVLKTIEENFGLLPLNSGDTSAESITEVWK